jgi:hypothetical protein
VFLLRFLLLGHELLTLAFVHHLHVRQPPKRARECLGRDPRVVVNAPQRTTRELERAPTVSSHLTDGIRHGRLVCVLCVPHGGARVDPDRPLGALPESQLDDAVFRDLWSVVRAKGQADSPGGTRAKARRSPRSV